MQNYKKVSFSRFLFAFFFVILQYDRATKALASLNNKHYV